MSVDEHLAKMIRKVDETCVASRVTPSIVDLLEIVNVEQDQRADVIQCRPIARLVQKALKAGPVGNASERVAFRLRAEKFPSHMIFCYILLHAKQLLGSPVRASCGCRNPYPALDSVRAHDSRVQCEAIAILYGLRSFPLEQFARFFTIKSDGGFSVQGVVASQAENIKNAIGPVKPFTGKIAGPCANRNQRRGLVKQVQRPQPVVQSYRRCVKKTLRIYLIHWLHL